MKKAELGHPPHDPRDGYIPDEQTAIGVAEVVSRPFYGKDRVAAERPFKAVLKDDVWTVHGSLPAHMMGGALRVKIAKKDGRIIELTHEQ